MQRTQAAKSGTKVRYWINLGPEQKSWAATDNANQHAHNTPNYSHDGELAHHFVVISLCVQEVSINYGYKKFLSHPSPCIYEKRNTAKAQIFLNLT